MKKFYISPVCEYFLTDSEATLQITSAYVGSGDPGGLLPIDPSIPVVNGDNGGGTEMGSGGFAKGGSIWDNTIFD